MVDLVHIQLVSSRYLTLGRDNTVWKEECFTHSRSEAKRRRQHQLDIQDARLAELRYALDALPGSENIPGVRVETDRESERDRGQQHRASVNWDPAYPGERLCFYEEYISRHAPVQIGWLDVPSANKEHTREATGVGILNTSTSNHVVAPLDDGSICIYDISARSTSDRIGGNGRLLAQSRPGLLSGQPSSDTDKSHTIMTETGAVECVSIDSSSQTGYFAVGSQLHQVDLNTLQSVSTKAYPFPITSLSNTSPQTPLAIGTNHTIHLHDPRNDIALPCSSSPGIELIGGLASHATLPQPGPLSILHEESSNSIWVAGRFTSLLTYDARYFPRLLSTTFSGARIASLSLLPHPYIPRHLSLLSNPNVSVSDHHAAKSASGSTIFAAGEYKGKGSLELYSTQSRAGDDGYRNRQTASASKLLAVARQGGKVVCSDGDGNLRWFERDGSSHIRTFNIQEAATAAAAVTTSSSSFGMGRGGEDGGLWRNSAPGQEGDIVQKMINISAPSPPPHTEMGTTRQDIGDEKLLLWTGDGRLGILGFGHKAPICGEDGGEEEEGKSTIERAREDAERQYGMAMRRALKRQAEEVRFVRGLGMGY